MTVFLHTADLHLNAQRRLFPQTYMKRAKWVLDTLEEIAVERECDCIVVAGDVFEQANLTNAERYLFSEWLGRLRVPTLIISGNHDTRSTRIGDTCLRDLSALRLRTHLIYDGDPRVFSAFGTTWLLIPNHGWADADFNLIVHTMVEVAQEQYPSTPIVVVMHEAVNGSQTDSGHLLAPKIHLNASLDVTYWAMGDIHMTQKIIPNAFYSGAPYQVDFGENMEKGALLVDTDAPTEPQYIEMRCPYPLVTVTKPRGRWPEFSRYVGTDDVPLPSHVVRVAPAAEEVVIDVAALQSLVPPLWGLEANLSRQALDDALIPKTLEHANKMLEDYQTKNA